MDGSKRSMGKSKKKQMEKEYTKMPDEDQAGFIRKTYGLFSCAIAMQLVWVILITQQEKDGALRAFAKNFLFVFIAGALVIVATTLVLLKKSSKEPVPTAMGYACWAMQAIGLSYIAGFMAARKDNATTVLVVEISLIVITIICTFFGGQLLKLTNMDKKMKTLGSTFLILSVLLATVLIAASALGIPGMKSKVILCVFLVITVAMLIADTQFVMSGRYGAIDKDDYVFASMKLFADFILMFTLIMQLFE